MEDPFADPDVKDILTVPLLNPTVEERPVGGREKI